MNLRVFENCNISRDICPLTFNSKTCRLQSRVKNGNIATHRISGESPGDSILRSFGPLPFPFHGNAYILSIRFVGIMAPSGTRRSSFNARGTEFHDRGGRREISRGREIKYGTLSYSICPASPYPVHPSRHYLPLTSFPGVHYFLPSTMVRAFLTLCLSSASPLPIRGKRDGG